MKNLVKIGTALLCCGAMFFFASCEEENLDEQVVINNSENEPDCPDFFFEGYSDGNVGSPCETPDAPMGGVINENCECIADDEPVEGCESVTNLASFILADFPDGIPSGYFSPGDDCYDSNDQQGVINENCECDATLENFDCPEIQANEGDPCQDSQGNYGNIFDCECIAEVSEVDCPGLGNIGDPCQGGWGTVTDDCDCVENTTGEACDEVSNLAAWYPLEFPNGIFLNVGDQCWDANDQQGTVSDNCECIAN